MDYDIAEVPTTSLNWIKLGFYDRVSTRIRSDVFYVHTKIRQ